MCIIDSTHTVAYLFQWLQFLPYHFQDVYKRQLFRKETMTIDKKLEELKRKKVAAEKKLIAAQHKEKQLEHELKRCV